MWVTLPNNFTTHIFVSQNAFWKAYMTVKTNAIQVGNDIQVGYNLKGLLGTLELHLLLRKM